MPRTRNNGDDDLPVAPPYEITPKSRRRPRAPFDVESTELPGLVTAIVRSEGPIHHEELSRRIADSYDTRHTRKLREGVARTIDLTAQEGKLVRKGDFLWPLGKSTCTLRGPVKGESPRDIDHIPDEEIEDGVRTVLTVDLRLPKDALTKAIAHLLGHRRNDRVVEAMHGVVEEMAETGEVVVDEEFVTLPD